MLLKVATRIANFTVGAFHSRTWIIALRRDVLSGSCSISTCNSVANAAPWLKANIPSNGPWVRRTSFTTSTEASKPLRKSLGSRASNELSGRENHQPIPSSDPSGLGIFRPESIKPWVNMVYDGSAISVQNSQDDFRILRKEPDFSRNPMPLCL